MGCAALGRPVALVAAAGVLSGRCSYCCGPVISLTVAGQDFLSFQWDILLLEAGFLAIFFSPLQFGFPPIARSGAIGDRAVAYLVASVSV